MLSISETFKNIYAHFPFCETKCHYCDFFSLPESSPQYTERESIYLSLEKELRLYSTKDAETIFLGGGTPSLAEPEILAGLLRALRPGPNAEVTMEANPSSITRVKADAWRAGGVNRVSMGVQALNDARLEWLGRVHSKDAAYRALEALFGAGIPRVSIDYIVGVPNQSLDEIENELSEVLRAFPLIEHVSAYLLTLKNSNPKVNQLPDDSTQLAHLEKVESVLRDHGFLHYEISNFAKPGAESRHNMNYWAGGTYLGIGPSGHSYDGSQRFKNWASLHKYRTLVDSGERPIEWSEALTREQVRIEHIMLGLRTHLGLDVGAYETRFPESPLNPRKLEEFKKHGLLDWQTNRVTLTSKGMFLSDEIISKII